MDKTEQRISIAKDIFCKLIIRQIEMDDLENAKTDMGFLFYSASSDAIDAADSLIYEAENKISIGELCDTNRISDKGRELAYEETKKLVEVGRKYIECEVPYIFKYKSEWKKETAFKVAILNFDYILKDKVMKIDVLDKVKVVKGSMQLNPNLPEFMHCTEANEDYADSVIEYDNTMAKITDASYIYEQKSWHEKLEYVNKGHIVISFKRMGDISAMRTEDCSISIPIDDAAKLLVNGEVKTHVYDVSSCDSSEGLFVPLKISLPYYDARTRIDKLITNFKI